MKRQIDLEGCLNFRDLGGYPTVDGRKVRWRQVYRADALHLLTPADVARLLDELRLSDVVDLRSTAERRADPRRPLDEAPVRVHHAPLFESETAYGGNGDQPPVQRPELATAKLADLYVGLAEMGRPAIARVVTLIAESSGPCVYHCAAGKDRTGIVSAVVLGALGVRDEIIVADYAATRENLDAIIERLLSTEGYRTTLAALPPDTMHAEPETMIDLLARLRERYGSIRDYACAAGVTEEALQRLEERLLES